MERTGPSRQIRVGGLDAIEIRTPGAPGAARPWLALVLHGYGADMHDLAPLVQALPAPAGTRWLFLNAPLEVPLGPLWTGRAWFPIDVAALERAMASGAHRDLSGAAPPELTEAREAVFRVVAEAGARWGDVVLAGFSQGAMVATEVAIHAPERPAGLLLWSGTLLQEAVWRALAPRQAGLRFVQSHGRADPLLALAAAERLHALLREAGWRGELVRFDGGHELPGPALAASAALLRALAAPSDGAGGPAQTT